MSGCNYNKQATVDSTNQLYASGNTEENQRPQEDMLSSIGVELLDQKSFLTDFYIPQVTKQQYSVFRELLNNEEVSVEQVCEFLDIRYLKLYADFFESGDYYYTLVSVEQASGEYEYKEVCFFDEFTEIHCLNITHLQSNAGLSMLDQITSDMSQSDVIELLGGGYSELDFPNDYSQHLIKDNDHWYMCHVSYENWCYTGYIVRTL